MERTLDHERHFRANRRAFKLGHSLPIHGNWVNEEGDEWSLCQICGGLGQINEDGPFEGPALTDPCSGKQGGYVITGIDYSTPDDACVLLIHEHYRALGVDASVTIARRSVFDVAYDHPSGRITGQVIIR